MKPLQRPQAMVGEGSGTYIYSSQVTLVGTGDRNALYVAGNLSHGPVAD